MQKYDPMQDRHSMDCGMPGLTTNQVAARRFEGVKFSMKWQNQYISTDVESMDALIECYQASLKELKTLRKLVEKGKVSVDFEEANDDLIVFETSDPTIADTYGMKIKIKL